MNDNVFVYGGVHGLCLEAPGRHVKLGEMRDHITWRDIGKFVISELLVYLLLVGRWFVGWPVGWSVGCR